jgi:hypothetical protein
VDDEIGGPCGMHAGEHNFIELLVGNPENKTPIRATSVIGPANIKKT